ncbi:unnamed protein product [Urochloa humidicola]
MLLFSLPSHLSPPPPIPAKPLLQSASEPRGLRRRQNSGAGLGPREGAEANRPEPGAGHGRSRDSSSRRSMMPAHPPPTSTPFSAHTMNTFGGAQANHWQGWSGCRNW